jgi:hypothetical protein
MTLRQFPKRALRSSLVNTRTQRDLQCSRRKCVYSIFCECGMSYFGENGRLFGVRLKEHRNNFKHKLRENSKLHQQAYDKGQCFR